MIALAIFGFLFGFTLTACFIHRRNQARMMQLAPVRTDDLTDVVDTIACVAYIVGSVLDDE